jgi:hypothetical protein
MNAIERKLPPIAELAIASMVAIVAGGVCLAAHLPRHAPPALPTAMLVVSAGLIVANLVLLSRLENFAWKSFFLVAKWSLVAYVVIAGMLQYVFVKDGTSGGTLVLVTLMLVAYAINIPLLFAFSVARYQDE